MTTISLTGDQLFWIIVTAMTCLLLGWSVTFISLRNNSDHVRYLLVDGNLVRLLTVIFVVFAATVLAAMDSLSASVSAIFSGIVGYVLGSMRKTEHIPQ